MIGSKRSTVELLALMIAATVCAMLLISAGGIAIIEVANPESDTTGAVVALTEVTSTLIGAILGLLAGYSAHGGLARAKYKRSHKGSENDGEPGPASEYKFGDGGDV